MSDDELLRRPIVILGAPRSGTTLLSQLLKNHPRLYLANEPRILWKYGNDARSDLLGPQHATPAVRQEIRGRLAGEVRAAGATRLVEKTPSNSLRVGFVDRVLTDCVFVHILRDGLQSVLSIREFWRNHSTDLPGGQLWRRLKEARLRQAPHYAEELLRRVGGRLAPGVAGPAIWGPHVPGINEWARDRDLLEVCAMQWRLCVEMACRDGRRLPPDRYTECRLEDFDEGELNRIMRFCGLEACEEVSAGYHAKFDTRKRSTRSAAAADSDIAAVQDLIAPTVAWLKTLPPANRHATL
ncbi:MAG: sulfotransferase [Planctomycetota bacterium]